MLRFVIVVGLLATACGSPVGSPATQSPAGAAGSGGSAGPDVDSSTVHATFVADLPEDGAQEAYVCYAMDAAGIDGKLVGSITWTPPEGPVAVHHASLFAARDVLPPGPVSCDPMPDRVAAFGLYTPGAVPVELPEGTAISLPPGTRSLVVLAHAIRFGKGAAEPTKVDLTLVPSAEHPLNWVDVFGPVPTLYPHRSESSVGVCLFDAPVHIVTDWPHMHQHGASFTGLIVRADGHAETLIDVPAWDYNHQPIYRVDADLQAGDAIETICTWDNTTDDTVVAGPFLANEMCNQGLFVWPFDHARCAN